MNIALIFITWITTAVVFFFIGRHTKTITFLSKKEESIDDIVTKAKSYPQVIKPGVIPFRTPEEIELEKSGDKALDDHWKNNGIGDLVKGNK